MTDAEILGQPIAQLRLVPEGALAQMIEGVIGELRSRGINLIPQFTLGEPDFWTMSGTIGINVPWFLANNQLWRLARAGAFPFYSPDAVMRLLRHEVGHAVFYAYHVAAHPWARAAFGNFSAPYREGYRADPGSQDFVRNLHGIHPSLDDYAQKHPEEDWAETFAAWLSHGPRPLGTTPAVSQKLGAVAGLMAPGAGLASPDRTVPNLPDWRRLPGTVGEGLGRLPLDRRR